MKTSQEWWNEVKQDPKLFNEWLVKQYRGEITAVTRIKEFANDFAMDGNWDTLQVIAAQEQKHADLVLQLLKNRGIIPQVENAEKRYWSATLPEIKDFETGCAIAAHAEKMRLERIQVIVEDPTAPLDVHQVFTIILRDELWHAEAFETMSTELAMSTTKGAHEAGKALLGLEA